jgi:TrmH family RNA methyltransferase
MRANLRVTLVLTSEPDTPLVTRAQAAGASVYHTSRTVIEAASPVHTPAGIVAIASWSPAPLARVWSSSPALVIGIVDVQDPGNLGSIIRSADALGATGVVSTPAGADPRGWKALRGAMGSTFRLPVARAPLSTIVDEARRAGLRIAASTADGGRALESMSLVEPVLVLLGNEGAGLPGDVISKADMKLSIPMREGANSLNVGAAAALVLYEARRQRQSRSK